MDNPLRKIFSWVYPVQLERSRGELNHDLEVNVHNGKVVLDSASVNYSYGSLQEIFDRAFEKTHLYDASIQSALILGFGSGSVAELLLEKCDPEMSITGVEADAEVIRLAKKYFPVAQNKNVEIIHATAEEYITAPSKQFDLVVVDVFIEDKVPATCQSYEFLRRVKSFVNPKGKVYFNKMDVDHDEVTAGELEKNLRSVFRTVKPVKLQMGGGVNVVFVAAV